jgi:hypothetical protein
MKIFIAEAYRDHSKIELISGTVGLFQEPLTSKPFFEAKTLELSDAILVPHDAYYFSMYSEYLKYLNELSTRKLVIFSDRGDFPKKPKIKNSVALRVAINPGESCVGKVIIPYNVESLDYLPHKKLESKPTVSFVGFMPRLSLGRVRNALLQNPFHPLIGNGAVVRRLTNQALLKSDVSYIKILRKSYGALDDGQIDLGRNRSEYVNAVNESDFVACPRGDANQSARFYESLSAGRIPIIPNSSIIFPHAMGRIAQNHFIDLPLRRGCVDNLISDYYDRLLNQNQYNKLQNELRQCFVEHFRFETFVNNIFSLSISQFLKIAFLL